jgi:large subunit ribosomal protein L23
VSSNDRVERLLGVLIKPVISEKTQRVAESGQYVFQVDAKASKHDIGAAVALVFGVKVRSVRVLNTNGKAKRFGGRLGKRSPVRKAYVRLATGEEIDVSGAVREIESA